MGFPIVVTVGKPLKGFPVKETWMVSFFASFFLCCFLGLGFWPRPKGLFVFLA